MTPYWNLKLNKLQDIFWFRNYKSKIVKFEKEIGHNSKEYDYNILVLEMPDGKRVWCDVVNAFSNHEILLKPKNNTAQKLLDSQKSTSASKHSKTSKSKPLPVF